MIKKFTAINVLRVRFLTRVASVILIYKREDVVVPEAGLDCGAPAHPFTGCQHDGRLLRRQAGRSADLSGWYDRQVSGRDPANRPRSRQQAHQSRQSFATFLILRRQESRYRCEWRHGASNQIKTSNLRQSNTSQRLIVSGVCEYSVFHHNQSNTVDVLDHWSVSGGGR